MWRGLPPWLAHLYKLASREGEKDPGVKKPRRSRERSGGAGTEKRPIVLNSGTYPTPFGVSIAILNFVFVLILRSRVLQSGRVLPAPRDLHVNIRMRGTVSTRRRE